jgi:hypothetical protein
MVNFTFTVTNDGINGSGLPIRSVSVSDNYAGTATYVSGDDGDGLLETGETWLYAVSYTVLPTDPSPLINTATVIGYDPQDRLVRDTDSHTTILDHAPGINIIKTGPPTARLGETIVYTFVVGNVSFTPTALPKSRGADGSPISNVIVTDSIAYPVTYVSGDDGNDLLETGEAWIYTARHLVQDTDPDPLVNVAIVTGRDRDGDVIRDMDDHNLDIDHVPILDSYSIYMPIIFKKH